jgi:chromosomal replication initiation ATPase DnaA
VSIALCVAAVSHRYGLREADVAGSSKRIEYDEARRIAAFVAHGFGYRYAMIGRHVGHQSASAIKHAVKQIEHARLTDPVVNQVLNDVRMMLR